MPHFSFFFQQVCRFVWLFLFFPFHQQAQFCQTLVYFHRTPTICTNWFIQPIFQLIIFFFLNCSNFLLIAMDTHPGHWRYSKNQYFHSMFFCLLLFFNKELSFQGGTSCYLRVNRWQLWALNPLWSRRLRRRFAPCSAETTDSEDCYRLIGVPPGASTHYATEFKVVQRGDRKPG